MRSIVHQIPFASPTGGLDNRGSLTYLIAVQTGEISETQEHGLRRTPALLNGVQSPLGSSGKSVIGQSVNISGQPGRHPVITNLHPNQGTIEIDE